MNRFKRLDLVNCVPEELWSEVCTVLHEAANKTIPKKKTSKKAKCLFEKPYKLLNRKTKSKGERERYIQLNTDCQRTV